MSLMARFSSLTSRIRRARVLVGASTLFVAFGFSALQASPLNYTCVLAGDQEVPANGSTGFGGGEFRIDTDANTVTYRIVYTGLSAAETGAHIHGFSDPGANSGVVHVLPLGTLKVGVWNYAEAQEGDILAGKTYVNVHSAAFPGGEIRGQIVSLNTRIDGAQEVPANASAGTGWGTFMIDTVANTLSYHIEFAGLGAVETAAHIHGAAAHGSNAGVAHNLGTGTPKIGTWNYSDADELDILSGRMYVNIHSAAFPGGEIRGQIVPIVVPIDAMQEVPVNASTATGIGLISIDQGAQVLGFDIRYGGLSGAETAAHIHGFAPAGANAGVKFGLPSPAVRKLGTWNYVAADEAGIIAGRTYINIHSAVFGGGEIRGQIQGLDCAAAVDVPELIAAPGAALLSNTPNPFDGSTTVEFQLVRPVAVELSVVDVTGRRVKTLADRTMTSGSHQIVWDGRDDQGVPVASGVYYSVLRTAEGTQSATMALIR